MKNGLKNKNAGENQNTWEAMNKARLKREWRIRRDEKFVCAGDLKSRKQYEEREANIFAVTFMPCEELFIGQFIIAAALWSSVTHNRKLVTCTCCGLPFTHCGWYTFHLKIKRNSRIEWSEAARSHLPTAFISRLPLISFAFLNRPVADTSLSIVPRGRT